jgi:hypothetical protein
MNSFQQLKELVVKTIEEGDDAIIEISSLKELVEITGMGMGDAAGAPDNKKIRRENKMLSREQILFEKMIRNKIRSFIKEERDKQNKLENNLREVIRSILEEGDISDAHPHRSTGINTLEDVLKKSIPTLRTDFKKLTTDKKQRDSFRAHIVNAVVDSLKPSQVNDKYLQGSGSGEASALMAEPLGSEEEELSALESEEEEFVGLEEAEIEVVGDEEKKIPVEDDDEPSPEEEFGMGMEDQDETGRNMAYTSYRKISQYILDAFDSLANPQDKKIFQDYLVTNLKLYFDKFEDELQNTVEEPSTPEYDQQKVA